MPDPVQQGEERPLGHDDEIAVGQIWERPDGSAFRVQGFSPIDGWVKVREIGGERERTSYPRTTFRSGVVRRVGMDLSNRRSPDRAIRGDSNSERLPSVPARSPAREDDDDR